MPLSSPPVPNCWIHVGAPPVGASAEQEDVLVAQVRRAREHAARVAGDVDRAVAADREAVAAVGRRGRAADLRHPLEAAGRVDLHHEHVVARVAGVRAVEVALRVADDHRVAGGVELQAVGAVGAGRAEHLRPELRAGRAVLDQEHVLETGAHLAVDRPRRGERLVDVAVGVDRHAALAVLVRAAGERRLHDLNLGPRDELERVLRALLERRAPDLPVVPAVQHAQLGGHVRLALDRLVELHRLEVEVVLVAVGVLVLVVADRHEHVRLQAGRRANALELLGVVQVLVDRVANRSRPWPKAPNSRVLESLGGFGMYTAGLSTIDADEQVGMRERVADRAVAAHRVAADDAAVPLRQRPVGRVDVPDQVLRERRLDRAARVRALAVGALVLRVDVVARPVCSRERRA